MHTSSLPAEYTKDTYVNNLASECPLIVFVNSRSGGRLGADLTLRFHRRLGRSQVRVQQGRQHGNGKGKGGAEVTWPAAALCATCICTPPVEC